MYKLPIILQGEKLEDTKQIEIYSENQLYKFEARKEEDMYLTHDKYFLSINDPKNTSIHMSVSREQFNEKIEKFMGETGNERAYKTVIRWGVYSSTVMTIVVLGVTLVSRIAGIVWLSMMALIWLFISFRVYRKQRKDKREKSGKEETKNS